MKAVIMGDTHRKLDKAFKVLERVKGLDLFIHTGDHYDDAVLISRQTGIPFIAVRGNCDGSVSPGDFAIAETEYGKIFVTHGHMYSAPEKLISAARNHDCIAAVCGHTHIPVYEERDGFCILNPGSLSRPRDGSDGSYIVLITSKSAFSPGIVYYRDDPARPKGGFIRNMLNNSDRF